MNFRNIISCLAFACVLSLASSLANAAPSALELLKIPTHSQVELSPSGRYFSMVYAKTDARCVDAKGQIKESNRCPASRTKYKASYNIIIYDQERKAAEAVYPLPDDFYVRWLVWANEDQLLAGIARRTTTNNRGTRASVGGSRIISMPRTPGDLVVLFEDSRSIRKSNFRLSEITNLLPDDPEHVIIPAYKGAELDLWKVNIISGEHERIAVGQRGTYYWFTDREGKPTLRYDANPRGTKIYVYSWSDDEDKWQRIRTFNLRNASEDDDYDFYPITAAENPDHLYVLADEDTDDRRSIKIYDIKTDTYVETVFEHDVYDVSNGLVYYSTGDYAGAWYVDDRLKYALVNRTTQAHINGLNQFFNDEANVAVHSFDRTGNIALIFVSAPDMPGEYYVYNFSEANLEPILLKRPELAAVQFGKGEILSIPTRDGETITGYLTHPAAGKDAQAPLLVMPHGGPEARDYFDYDSTIQYFATRGYRVLQMNFRGSSGYGRAFAEAGYGEWGGVMQNDVTDAVTYLHDRNIASPDQTCIVGYSYGGYAALQGAVSTPELYKCVVSGGGVTDLLEDLKDTRQGYGADSETYEYWLKSIGDPQTDKEKLDQRSPVNFAHQIQAPVLLIHGEYDGIVSIDQAKSMRRALQKAGAEVEFVEFKFEGHGGWPLEIEIQYLETIEQFVSKHLAN